MNILNVIAIIQLLAGAAIIALSIILCLRTGKQYLKKMETQWLVIISLAFGGLYSLLIVLWFLHVLPPGAFSGGIVMICSCLVASMAAFNKGITKRLLKEIEEHSINKQKIEELSLHDQLTNLYNRRGFISIVEQHLKRLRRLRKRAVLFYAELQNLHSINEKSGYTDGDMLLTNIGTLMTATFRQADVLARIGDKEFMAFLVDADSSDMESIHQSFQDAMQKYNEQRSTGFKLFMSFGVSSHDPEMIKSANEIIHKASASVKLKNKGQQNRKTSDSRNHACNFTLIVSNMCSMSFPVDIKIHIDGELSVNDIFNTGMQNTWKSFHFSLSKGKHTIQASTRKGKASFMKEFKIRDEHWASIEFQKDNSAAQSSPGTFSFHIHDVPLKHGFVRPIIK